MADSRKKSTKALNNKVADSTLSVVDEQNTEILINSTLTNESIKPKRKRSSANKNAVQNLAETEQTAQVKTEENNSVKKAVETKKEEMLSTQTSIEVKPKSRKRKAVVLSEEIVASDKVDAVQSEYPIIEEKKSRKRNTNAQTEEISDAVVSADIDNSVPNNDEITLSENDAEIVEVKPKRKYTKRKVEVEQVEEKPTTNNLFFADDFQDEKEKERIAKEEKKKLAEQKKADRALAKQQKKEERQRQKLIKKNKKLKASIPLERVAAAAELGLTSEQVQDRTDRGLTNFTSNIVSKSYFSIFRSNVFTLFNFLNFFLATLILIFGSIKNMLFIGIVVANMIIGIIQEIRSKVTLDKMTLLASPKIDVVRNGVVFSVSADELVLDDIFILKSGQQVPADCELVSGAVEVNESLLTGEQDDVSKRVGDGLYSGSFIQAGECRVRAVNVGEQNFSAKLMAEAKKFKKSKSELMRSINTIIRIVTVIIFPLGALMFFTNYRTTLDVGQTVTNAVASIVGMIPEGLVMLTSIALAVGVVKLARKRTLVQDLYCIETLARVDMLCLDKTGTITEGTMQVEKTHEYTRKYGFAETIMANMVSALGSDGSTFSAFANYFHSDEVYNVVRTVPFSSARKWSGVDFGSNGKFIVGAPEFVLKRNYKLIERDVSEYASQGYRVLVLVRTAENLSDDMDVDRMKVVALIILSDKIRDNAKSTLEYFARQGVSIKVISGDNPVTVSKVAERAGLAGADKYIDATELDTDEKIYEACEKYTVFGRVTPKQKKVLVAALKSHGHTVGMTGDGVNDVMALKEADCSIAMASGSDASRSVAQLVLLDSDFASLPSVVAEGRRVINNIERAASLFLVKTTFSVVLSLILICLQLPYPFEPIQLTLINALFVGLPSFFLAIEPNDSKVSGKFLSKVFNKALPAGLTVAAMISIICYIYSNVGLDVTAQISTMAFYVTSVVAVVVLIQVCAPYNKERLFLIGICVVVYLAAVTSNFLREILSLSLLTTDMTIKLIIICVCSLPMIVIMRTEIEAVKTLLKNGKDSAVRIRDSLKSVFNKNKE